MSPRALTRSITTVTALALPVTLLVAPAAAALGVPRGQSATVSVLHAIPLGQGADVVDVYTGGRLVADDLTPGELRTLRVPAGRYDIRVVSNGGSLATPLLSAPRTQVTAGANLTVTAHLTATGAPELTVFANNTTTVGMGMGRLTIRHVAQAPAVDVRAGSAPAMRGLRSTEHASIGLMAGNYPVTVTRAGSRVDLIRPSTVTIRNEPGRQDMGTTTIVYLWGSTEDGSLRRAIQEVPIDLR